jgi:hypothetical protein
MATAVTELLRGVICHCRLELRPDPAALRRLLLGAGLLTSPLNRPKVSFPIKFGVTVNVGETCGQGTCGVGRPAHSIVPPARSVLVPRLKGQYEGGRGWTELAKEAPGIHVGKEPGFRSCLAPTPATRNPPLNWEAWNREGVEKNFPI